MAGRRARRIMFRFDFDKALQAAGVLLSLDGDRMERIRLLKLLYIADRELLVETLTGVTSRLGPSC